MEMMPLPTYCSLIESVLPLSTCFSPVESFIGGIDAVKSLLIEKGIDMSSLVWGDNTVLPLNTFDREMAKRANKIIKDFKASIARGSLSPSFLEAIGDILFATDGSLFEAIQYVSNKILFLKDKVLSAALERLPSVHFQAVLSKMARLSSTFQAVMGSQTAIALMVIVVSLQLWKGRRPGNRAVLIPGCMEDDNNVEQDGKQLSSVPCRVTFDEPSDAYRTAKAPPPRQEFGLWSGYGQNMWVAPDGKVQYRVGFPSTKEIGWFRADQVQFDVEETFNGHDLRKRV